MFRSKRPPHRKRESFSHLVRDDHLAALSLEKQRRHLSRVAVAFNIEMTLLVGLRPGASL